MQPVEIIHDMRALLRGGDAWVKGSYARYEQVEAPDDEDTEYTVGSVLGYCLVGSALVAAGESAYELHDNSDYFDDTDYVEKFEGLVEVMNAIAEVTREQFADRLFAHQEIDQGSPLRVIPRFNDDANTTWVEVERVLDKAEVALTEHA